MLYDGFWSKWLKIFSRSSSEGNRDNIHLKLMLENAKRTRTALVAERCEGDLERCSDQKVELNGSFQIWTPVRGGGKCDRSDGVKKPEHHPMMREKTLKDEDE